MLTVFRPTQFVNALSSMRVTEEETSKCCKFLIPANDNLVKFAICVVSGKVNDSIPDSENAFSSIVVS